MKNKHREPTRRAVLAASAGLVALPVGLSTLAMPGKAR